MGVSGRSARRGSRSSASSASPTKLPSDDQSQTRQFWLRLLIIAAVALALRLITLAELHGSPLLDVLLGDAKQYDAWAQQIADGRGLGTTAFYQTPVYSYFMSLVFKITGHSVLVIRVLQSIFGAASCVLLGLAGRRFFRNRVGLVAAALLAAYPPAIFFDTLIQKSSLDGLFITAILAALGAFVARQRLMWLVLLGVMMGALMLNRENARVLYPVVLTWLLFVFCDRSIRKRLEWAGVVTAACALTLAPVVLHNYYAGGELFLSTSQLGPNFYIGNHANASGTYDPLIPERGSVEFERTDATQLAEAARGRPLSAGEVSSYWLGKSLEFIRSNPTDWLVLMARKLTLTVNAREVVDTESIEVYAESSTILRLLLWFNFGIVLPLALLGAWLTRRDARKLAVLYAVFGSLIVSVVLFYVMSRYRYPIVPVLLLFAAAALAAIPELRRIPIRGLIPGLAMLAIAPVYSHFSVRLPGDNTKVHLGSELVRMGRSSEAVPILRQAIAKLPDYAPAHFSLALALSEMGEREQALDEYETTVKLWPDDFKAQGALALALQDAGRPEDALEHFREAARLQPQSAPAQNNLAMALDQAGHTAEAIPHYEAAVALTPNYAEGHNNLAVALAKSGRKDEAVAHFTEALRLQPDNAPIHMIFGDFLMDYGRVDEALAHYQQAVALMPQSVEIQRQLGEAYLKAGRTAEAIERFNAAITVARSFGRTEAIQPLLDSIQKSQTQVRSRR